MSMLKISPAGAARFTRFDAMGIRCVDGEPEQTQGAAGVQTDPPPDPPAEEGKPPVRGNGEPGYPVDTPIAEMTPEQEAAYWKHKARAHEDRWKQVINRNLTPEQVLEMQQQLDEANAARMTDHERRIADARKEAETETRAALMPQLVRAAITAELARKTPAITDEDVQARTEYLDLSKFLTNKGEIDTDKVSSYATTLAPTPGVEAGGKRFPDMGGGKRGGVTESAKARAYQVARERGWVRDDK